MTDPAQESLGGLWEKVKASCCFLHALDSTQIDLEPPGFLGVVPLLSHGSGLFLG